jgi:hypothetical protein
MLLDLHQLKALSYNNVSGTVKLQLGLTIGQVLAGVDSQSNGQATLPAGLCSGIGVGGFLLGGGMGPLDSMAGLLCDRLEEVQMVTASGELVTATKNERPDVLWAACGGGGQALGVVVSATLSTFPTSKIGNSVCLRTSFDGHRAPEVFDVWQSLVQHKSHLRFEICGRTGRVNIWGCVWQRGLHDLKSFSSKGRVDNSHNAVRSISATDLLQDLGFRVSETVRQHAGANLEFLMQFNRFLDAQKFLGPAGKWGMQKVEASDEDVLVSNQWFFAKQQDTRSEKTMLTGPLSPWSIGFQRMADLCGRGPGDGGWGVCTIIPIGRAVGRRASDETAFHWRSARHSLEFTAGDTATEASRRQWAHDVYHALKDKKIGTYVNYPDAELLDYPQEYWGGNYRRLQELKAAYDASRMFDAPQGIDPRCPSCSMPKPNSGWLQALPQQQQKQTPLLLEFPKAADTGSSAKATTSSSVLGAAPPPKQSFDRDRPSSDLVMV